MPNSEFSGSFAGIIYATVAAEFGGVKQKTSLSFENPRDSIIGISVSFAAFEDPMMPQSSNIPAPPPKLLDQLREVIRRKHLSYATEEAYVGWCRRFILFHGKKHPKDMGEVEIREFLTDLAVTRRVAASTQNQALNALVFLYAYVLERSLGSFGQVERAKRPERLPVVLTRDEVRAILSALTGVNRGGGRDLRVGRQQARRSVGGDGRRQRKSVGGRKQPTAATFDDSRSTESFAPATPARPAHPSSGPGARRRTRPRCPTCRRPPPYVFAFALMNRTARWVSSTASGTVYRGWLECSTANTT